MIRTCPHRSIRTSFRQILTQTVLKILAGRCPQTISPSVDFCIVYSVENDAYKIMLENPHIYPMWTGSNSADKHMMTAYLRFRFIFL